MLTLGHARVRFIGLVVLLLCAQGMFAADVESTRAAARKAYQPARVDADGVNAHMTSLTGNWLFLPAQERVGGSPADPGVTDESWHVMPVPQFWNPIEWWIYFQYRGQSHKFWHEELFRCNQQTFDWRATKSAWYRHWIEIPKEAEGQRVFIHFDAIASGAEVFWNGERVAAHVGMFTPLKCEVTTGVLPGQRNLLAVYVAAGKADPAAAGEVAAVAVTMTVTKEILNSLPHTTFRADMGGIWQPVRLEIRAPGFIEDVYFQPTLDGATIDTTVGLASADLEPLWVRHTLVDEQDGQKLHETYSLELKTGAGAPHTTGMLRHSFDGISPKLWSPESPNLYLLQTKLLRRDTVIDEQVTTVGFRTFESRGDRLFLNGKPYFLRGANMPPVGIRPNDAALAHKFMKLMHDGNQMITRFHMCPPPTVWMDAADREGVGVSIEGSWPWIGISKTELPSAVLQEIWLREMAAIAKANRNHPSLLMTTISNESHFQGDGDTSETRKLAKFRIFDRAIRQTRELVRGLPVVLHSGYVRTREDKENILSPYNIDDGDIDDTHQYYGWYTKSPYEVDVAKDLEAHLGHPNRPLISQEASTGYPDNDTGHPTEAYLTQFEVPQTWLGRFAGYEHRPDIFLETHARITKAMAETIRRERTSLAGWMLFANCCWFRDVFDASRIMPYPAYWAVQRAWQPILTALELDDRNFVAGQMFESDVVVVNDAIDHPVLDGLSLAWQIHGKQNDPGTSGTVTVPECLYDGKSRVRVMFRVPENLPRPKSQMWLTLRLLRQGTEVSRNEYPLTVTDPEWNNEPGMSIRVVETGTSASEFLRRITKGVVATAEIDWNTAALSETVVVGPDATGAMMGSQDDLRSFLERGGRVVALAPDATTTETEPGLARFENSAVAAVRSLIPVGLSLTGVEGNYVEALVPQLTEELDPTDMQWWNSAGGRVQVCRVAFRFADATSVNRLMQHLQPHAYDGPMKAPQLLTWPVFEVTVGKGKLVVSTMRLANDPMAVRFHRNLLKYLNDEPGGQSPVK